MKNADTPPSATSFIGHVKNGVVVLNTTVSLADGQAVRVEPLGTGIDAARADRIRQMQQLFAEWNEEDGKLTDEEADRLHQALEQSHGLSFRPAAVD